MHGLARGSGAAEPGSVRCVTEREPEHMPNDAPRSVARHRPRIENRLTDTGAIPYERAIDGVVLDDTR